MHFNPYGGPAAELAATLVNARSGVRDAATVNGILDEHNRSMGTVGEADAAEVWAWVDRLSPAFGEPDLDTLVAVANGLLADSASRPYISRHDDRPPHIHYAHEDDDTVTRLKAFTAGGIAHALVQDPVRLGRCDSETCDVVYVDTSRNGRRRFCSTRCATRVHVADHRTRAAVS